MVHTKLITAFGIGTPRVEDVQDLVTSDRWQSLPFDGLSIVHEPPNAGYSLTYQCAGRRRFVWAELREAHGRLRNLTYGKLTERFLAVQIANEEASASTWDDEHAQTLVNNFRLAARLAYQTGMRGIAIDSENYGPLNKWSMGPKDDGWWRRRGAAVMSAMQDEHPNIYVLMTFGASDDPNYWGLRPFRDGMLEQCWPTVTLSTDTESYISGQPYYDYVVRRNEVQEGKYVSSELRGKYERNHEVSLSVWPDNKTEQKPFSNTDHKSNVNSPSDVRKLVREALRTTSRYVWVYDEQAVNWWTPGYIHPAYEEAVRLGRLEA